MTTYEIKERERRDLAAGRLENYAPWADHRAYMDVSFSQALERLRGMVPAVRDCPLETPQHLRGLSVGPSKHQPLLYVLDLGIEAEAAAPWSFPFAGHYCCGSRRQRAPTMAVAA